MTHSVTEMIQVASKLEARASDLLSDARGLDLHYIPARYPNGLPSGYPHKFYDREMAEEAIAAATRIFDLVTAYVKSQNAQQILTDE